MSSAAGLGGNSHRLVGVSYGFAIAAALLGARNADMIRSAGEVNGKGEFTPIHDWIAAICAFSRLEDDEVLGGRGVTQTPHFVEGFYPLPGEAAVCAILNPGKKPEESSE